METSSPKEEMLSKLEWGPSEKLKIPENHYTDTYNLFHHRMGDFGLGHLLNYFSPAEQYPLPDHDKVRSLETTSFKEMTEMIIQNSKPSHSETFTKTTKATNLKSLKKFVEDAAKSITENFCVTPPTIYLNLIKSIISILDDAELIDSEEETKMEKENNSIEIHKNGLVVIAYYRYEFHGKITQNCCSITHNANVAIEVKAWKFPTTEDLKNEYEKITQKKSCDSNPTLN